MASTTQITERAGIDQTVRIYDNFYSTKLQVNASDYDVVYSYFKGTSDSTVIAANFTALLFRIAQEGGFNVIELLEVIKGVENNLQMNSVICYYLNTFKSKTALYGTGIIPTPNEPVQRNVVL
jgi:hypothetical protein